MRDLHVVDYDILMDTQPQRSQDQQHHEQQQQQYQLPPLQQPPIANFSIDLSRALPAQQDQTEDPNANIGPARHQTEDASATIGPPQHQTKDANANITPQPLLEQQPNQPHESEIKDEDDKGRSLRQSLNAQFMRDN